MRARGFVVHPGWPTHTHACCATSAEEAAGYVEKMIGNVLVTKQTGPEGQLCTKVRLSGSVQAPSCRQL